MMVVTANSCHVTPAAAESSFCCFSHDTWGLPRMVRLGSLAKASA